MTDFQKAISINSNDGYTYYSRGQVYVKLENYEEAIEDYSRSINLLKDQNTVYRVYKERGNCFRHLKMYERSIEDLKKACESKNNDATCFHCLGLSFLKN